MESEFSLLIYVHMPVPCHVTSCDCQVFHDVAYKARNREDLLAGVDEFLDKVTVLPPGEWDPDIRLEPPPQVRTYQKVLTAL